MIRIDFINICFLEFYGCLNDNIMGVGIEFITDFHVNFYILSKNKKSDELEDELENILHEVLTESGVKINSNNQVIGYKFNIEYELLNFLKFEKKIKNESFICLYISKNQNVLLEEYNKKKYDLSNFDIKVLRLAIHQRLLGELKGSENFILSFDIVLKKVTVILVITKFSNYELLKKIIEEFLINHGFLFTIKKRVFDNDN